MKWIQLLSLVPYLNRHSLLTDDEQELLLNTQFTEKERILKLLALVEKKGTDGFRRFLKALEDEPEHTGHRSVVTLLKGALTTRTSTGEPHGFIISVIVSFLGLYVCFVVSLLL